MNKTFLSSKEAFESFLDNHTGYISEYGEVRCWDWFEPEKYPCIAVWKIEYDGNGPDMLDGEFVYLEDFEV